MVDSMKQILNCNFYKFGQNLLDLTQDKPNTACIDKNRGGICLSIYLSILGQHSTARFSWLINNLTFPLPSDLDTTRASKVTTYCIGQADWAFGCCNIHKM